MSSEVPDKVKQAGVVNWFMSISDMDRVKVSRYIESADASSDFAFFTSMIKAALADENYRFALTLCIGANALQLDVYQRFKINEEYIDALAGRELYDDAKNVCNINLQLFDAVKEDIKRDNGGQYPKKLNFRNRYIDIIVGVECQYDEAYKMLDKYFEMGLIDSEDLAYRKNSLKVHRLQRSFDGVYTYRPRGDPQSK